MFYNTLGLEYIILVLQHLPNMQETLGSSSALQSLIYPELIQIYYIYILSLGPSVPQPEHLEINVEIIGPRAIYPYCCHDRHDRNQPRDRPEFQFILR